MILTTTLLIVVTGVGAGLLNVMNIRRAFDESAAKRVELFQSARTQIGTIGTPLFARATEALVLEKGRDKDILTLVQNTVGGDTKDEGNGKKDFVLKLAYVLDLNQQVIAHCHEGSTLDCKVFEEHVPVSATLGQITVDSWKTAVDTWKKNAAGTNKGDVLVTFDLASGTSKYKVFAYPIFFGEAPTAAAAIAPEPPTARLGYVVLGYDLAPVEWFTQEANEQKAAAVTKAALYTGAVGALFALIGTVLAIFQGLSISKPIKQLAWKADQIARGDLDARVDVNTGDEIGLLGENFNFMADQIAILLQQTAEKAKIEQELEVAKAIQETLVPSDAPVRKGTLTFAGFYQPAAQTGGDWWTWAELASGKILVVIGDVTGHGLESGVLMLMVQTAVRTLLASNERDPEKFLSIVNKVIYQNVKRISSDKNLSLALLDYSDGSLKLTGQHEDIIIVRNDGRLERVETTGLGLPIGIELDITAFISSIEIKLDSGDVVTLYSDGITEAEDASQQQYGLERLCDVILRNYTRSSKEIKDAIIEDLLAHVGYNKIHDDITVLVIKKV